MEDFIISYNTKNTMKLSQGPMIRVNQSGSFTFNLNTIDLLEIEDPLNDGIVFGYLKKEAFIAYSNDVNAFKGAFKKGEKSFRFANKVEAEKIFKIFENTGNILVLEIIDEFLLIDGYKFYKLKKR